LPTGVSTIQITAALASDSTVTPASTNLTIQQVSVTPTLSISLSPTVFSTLPGSIQQGGGITFTAIVLNDPNFKTYGGNYAKGVSWSASCISPGSTSSKSCGSFSLHTGGNPYAFLGSDSYWVSEDFNAGSRAQPGTTVTVQATSTIPSGPSDAASGIVTDTMPIMVAFYYTGQTPPPVTPAPKPPPASLPAGAPPQQLTAVVMSDANQYGVNWSCSPAGNLSDGSPICGSFSPAHSPSNGLISINGNDLYSVKTTYTAPSTPPTATNGVVTIIATSAALAEMPTPNATTPIAITVPAPSVSISTQPISPLPAGNTTQVTASVANDPTSSGVTWSVKQCDSNGANCTQCLNTAAVGCGYIQPPQTSSGQPATYTAPPVAPSGTVRLVATSVADNSAAPASTNAIAIAATALSIGFVGPVPSQLQPAATVNVNAAVSILGATNTDSQSEGVDWQLSCADNCGYFTIKPAIPAINATKTTSFQPAVPAVTAISAQGWPNGLPIPYTAPVVPPSNGGVTITASAVADATKTVTSTVNVSNSGTRPALNGMVMAGSQPVSGATVQLFQAGTAGYASAATALTVPSSTTTIVTGSDGSFKIPAGYSCAQSSETYVVATGGSVGANKPNPDLAMMTALGPCGALSSQNFIVNEVTTVASVWPLAPFASNDPLTGNSSYQYIGSSSGNTPGLASAFATVNNLVDISTGQARSVVPASNAAVPYVTINTLADILNACTSTSGGSEGDGSACGTLLTDTDVLNSGSFASPTPPRDTLQAAFNIAQHPGGSAFGYSLATLFNPTQAAQLASAASPFQPILSAPPNDWSLSLNFSGGGGLSHSSAANYFAIDASGNLWITDSNAGSVIEWNNQGAAYLMSPFKGASGGGPLAIDSSGNIWVSGNGNLAELSNLGVAYPWSPYTGVAGGGADMAFDAVGNLWIGDGSGVVEFSNLSVELPLSSNYVDNGVTGLGAVAVDSSDNIWVAAANATLAELSEPSGQPIVNASLIAGINGSGQIAADGSGRIWVSDPERGAGFCPVQPANTTLLYHSNCQLGAQSSGGGFDTIYDPQGVAIDGAGYVWIANTGGSTQTGAPFAVVPNVTEIDPSELSGSGNYVGLASSSLSAGPLRVAVDRAGNVWVLLSDGTVTEFVGVATPVVTPIALGVKNNKLGAKP